MYSRNQCNSVLTTDSDEHIVTIRGSHNHTVPNISTTPDGVLHTTKSKKRGRKKKAIIEIDRDDLNSNEKDDDVLYQP